MKILMLFVMAMLPSYGNLLILSSSAKQFSYCKDCLRFPGSGSQHSKNSFFKTILVDGRNNQIIVGARNAVFRLDMTLKLSNQTDFLELIPPKTIIDHCIKTTRKRKDVCYNYITLLLFDEKRKIFACGTYATKPKCWRFERNGTLQAIPPKGIDGPGRSPKDPQHNVVGLFTTNDYLFTGLANSLKEPGVVYKSDVKGKERIVQQTKENEQFFKAPTNFVSTFTTEDNYIYFLFGETAVEERSLVSTSRIARVCKYDGGTRLQSKFFTTFNKAKLTCTVPGVIPFEYSEIQGAFNYVDDSSEEFIYATFNAPSLGAKGGAVCMYSVKNIQSVFKNSKYLERFIPEGHPESAAWVPVSPPPNTTLAGRAKCDSSLDTKRIPLEDLQFGNGHPLLSESIKPVNKHPLFVKSSLGFTRIVVDKVSTSSGNISVMFIGTDNGTVFKVFTNSAKKTPQVVEQFDIFEKQEAIYDMKFLEGALLVSSNSSIVKILLQQCSRYKTCRSCVSAQDPYCGWSDDACVQWKNRHDSKWSQDISFGDFASICEDTSPSCTITAVTDKPGSTTVLQCNAEGIPVPAVTGWTKDSTTVASNDSSSDYKVEKGETADSQKLLVMNFGVQHLGQYQCVVSNKNGESSCALSLNGTLPVITSGVRKIDGVSYFYCEAVAIPKAKVVIYKVIDGKSVFTDRSHVSLRTNSGRRLYYCVASNAFGPSVGKTVEVEDREIKSEIKLTRETWSSDLQNSSSQAFRTLADKIYSVLNQVYSGNVAFIGVKSISFFKGSVIASMKLEFAANPYESSKVLLADLQQAVSSGNVSGLAVDRNHPLSEEFKTEIPTTVTQAPTPSPNPTSSPAPSTVSNNPVTSTKEEPTAEPRVKEGVGDTGLFAGAILATIAITLVLSFTLGVLCHDRIVRHCRSSPDAENADGREIQAVKYQKSPTIDDVSFRKHPSKRKLLRKQQNSKELEPNNEECADEDYEDSDGSVAGQISTCEYSGGEKFSSPERTPVKKPNIKNGKVLNIC